MTNRELQERRKRRKRIRRLRMAVKIAVYALMAVLIGVIVWALASRFVKREDVPADKDSAIEEAAPEIGDAIKSAYTGTGGQKGWNVDEFGWWYLNDDETIYTDGWQTVEGNTYYFDAAGYMATGWKQIDGEYHYFRPDGIEEPEATEKLVAITYDDGPSNHTDRLLDCLEANGAKATFFVVGTQVEEFPETLQREESLGMEIGSHTYDHTYLKKADAETIQTVMSKNEEVLTSLLGHGTTLMRPTGGGISDTVRENVSQPMIIWDLDTRDWDTRDTDSIVNEVLNNVQDGSVVLLHDLYESTVAASEIFIPELISRGFRMVTVSELAELRGVSLESGKAYDAFYLPKPEEGDVLSAEAAEGTE